MARLKTVVRGAAVAGAMWIAAGAWAQAATTSSQYLESARRLGELGAHDAATIAANAALTATPDDIAVHEWLAVHYLLHPRTEFVPDTVKIPRVSGTASSSSSNNSQMQLSMESAEASIEGSRRNVNRELAIQHLNALMRLGDAGRVAVLGLTGHEAAAVRNEAVWAIGNSDHPGRTDDLLALLKDLPDRSAVTGALAATGEARARTALVEMWRSEGRNPQSPLLRLIARLPAAEPAGELAKLLAHEDVNERILAARALAGRNGPGDTAAILGHLLAPGKLDPSVWQAATASLTISDEADLKKVSEAMKGDDRIVERALALADNFATTAPFPAAALDLVPGANFDRLTRILSAACVRGVPRGDENAVRALALVALEGGEHSSVRQQAALALVHTTTSMQQVYLKEYDAAVRKQDTPLTSPETIGPALQPMAQWEGAPGGMRLLDAIEALGELDPDGNSAARLAREAVMRRFLFDDAAELRVRRMLSDAAPGSPLNRAAWELVHLLPEKLRRETLLDQAFSKSGMQSERACGALVTYFREEALTDEETARVEKLLNSGTLTEGAQQSLKRLIELDHALKGRKQEGTWFLE